MRIIGEGLTAEAEATGFKRGGEGESWQLMDGIIRCTNAGTGTCNVSIFDAYTQEAVDVVSVPASGAVSGARISIPYEYKFTIDTIVGSVNVSVYLDGDTA